MRYLVLFFLLINLLCFSNECDFQDLPIALASYPRSGNTWMRYCLEYLTKRPSFMNGVGGRPLHKFPMLWDKTFFRPEYPADNPLALTFSYLKVDYEKSPIVKTHHFRYTDTKEIPIVFLLRDYKECIIRENKYYFKPLEAIKREIEKGKDPFRPGHYFTILQQFDWYEGPKLLVYYEDLVTAPEIVLPQVLDFLGESDTYLDKFLTKINFHRKKSLGIYKKLGDSDTKGKDLKFHSKKLKPNQIKRIDEQVKEIYPQLWEKYLRRYSVCL